MRTLKVLLGVGVGVGLLATCTGWVLFRQPLAGTGDVYIGPETEKFIRFVQEQFGVGRSAAIDFMHRAGREQNARIIDRFNLPAGALVDFIEVDGSRPGATSARFLGTGRVFPALSEEGLAFWRIFERAALRHGWDKAYRAMAELRRRGIVIAPAWFGAGTSTATGAVRLVNTAATQATSIRVAVILARFPAWRDQSPQSDGRTQSYAAGRHYAPDDTGRLRNVEGLGPNYIDWYIDSPGGALLPDGGIPVGTQVQWDDEHPERAPQSYDGPTPLAAQEYWYKRLFDLNFPGSGSGEPNWPASLHNYYWENSHGKIDITGQRTDVYGWIESHHILDRLPYPQGPDPVYMIQPGTPIIRPSDEIVAADGVDRPILRASLTDQKLTILYKQEYLTGSPPMPRLFAYQQDVDGSTSGNQPGWVEIQIGAAGATNVIPDPYDRRRWTYVKVSWKFTDQADPTKTIDYKVWPGQDWRVQNLGYTWQRGERGYMPQDQGCGALPNTLFTRNDVLGSAPGNRFKSFDYYCHDHFVNTSRGPYQIEHIYHGSYVDDIGGDSEPVSARKPRAFPFDCGMPQALGGSDRPQLGFFHYPNNDNQGGHSAGEMRADVNLAMADLGISLSGPYDRIMYVFAGPGLGEGGGSAGNWGTIIAHAGGNMITVGEDAAMTIVAHELGHTLGMGDLYDMDLYTNVLSGTPPNPLFFECNGLGPYSVMAHGVRVDAFHLMKLGWVDKVVSLTEDRPNAEIPAIEGVLREPIIYKLPANPYYLVDGTAPDAWQEYFLVEYRSKSGGAYFGDPSTPGVYIYHVDERAPQTVEQVLAVAMEQADGKFELENNLVRAMNDYPQAQVGPGTTGTDPFGVPESRGGADNFNFCQWDFQIDDWLAGNSNPPTAPTSYSHGLLGRDSNGRPYIIGGTDTDSFVRVLNINVPPNSPIAYADIYVRPREIVVTGEDAWKDLVNGDGDPTNDPAWQGLQNVPVLKLTLENQRNTGPGDYQHMSTGDVTVQHIRVVESGSSPNDTDVALAKIWADSDNDGAFDPTKDTLLSTATFNNQVALFAALNYNVPLGQSRVLFITYDFSETAQINPKVTVAADLPEPRYVWPEPPGTVQTRARTAAQFQFGGPRFPIQSDVHYVIEGTDTVFISASSLAPTEVHPNDQLIPVLRAILSVDRDRAIVRRLRMVCRPAAGASDPQRDVARATLWLDVDANGTVEPGSDTRLADAVFSNKQMVLFDGLNLTVAAGQSIHLIATVDIAENATIGNWLELEMPTWYDDNGTPSNPADDTYYVELVDEDGAGNTYYEDPNNPGVIRDVAHGADPATWKIVAGLDVVDTSGAPWKSIDFRVTPPQKPQLTNASLVPPSGDKSNVFTFRVTYTSPAGIAPAFVRLVYRNLGWNGSRANQVLTMREVDPADRNVTDGKDYWIQITGLPDWGIYKHYYWASDGYTEVWYYDPDGPGQGQPEGYYTSPDSTGPRQADVDPALTDWLEGPVLGMPSSIRFADAAWNDANTYEEGRVTDPATAARVYVEVRDPDENVDRTNPDTLIVTVSCDDGSDSETITLTETGPDTATFRGSIPTIGRSGAADDGWLNAIAGSAGLGITAVYKDKDDLPQPGDIDTSRTSATVVDTTPPAPVAPITARSGVQGRTIDVDWSGYDEAGQIDVAGYRVYCETSDYNSVAGLTPVQTLTAGTRTCTITGLQPDTDYFIAVTAVDEVPNENTSVVTVRVHTVDSQPPVLISRSPAPNATGIALDARTITARVRDTGTGINTSDPDAVQMTVTADDGTGARTVSGSLTVTGGGAAGTAPVDITWTADQDWRWNDVVTVDLKVYDRAGNELHATWRFSVYTDKSPPALVAGTPTPGDGQTNVPLDAQIVCEVQDQADRGMPASNLDLSSLSFQVTVTNRGNQTFQQTFTNADSNPNGPFTVTVIDAGHILITYTHAAGWTWNDVVAVDLTIADNAGNQLRHTWTFQVIEDLAPPYVQARSPDDGQRQVSLDAPIVITMADNVSGVDTQSVQVEIRVENRGAERIPWTDITQDPNYTASWSVDYTQGTLRYQPADGWLYNDVVSVRVRATDRAGNAMTDWAQWSFSVLEDTDDLAIIDPSPASGATNVPRNTNISFRVIDSVSGVDRATIGLQIDGQAVNFSDLQISGDEHDYTVVYDPPANFDYGQTVQCRATAKDVAGNSTELVWTFTTEGDFNPPIITAVAPLPDATGVPIGSTVSVRIADPETGVDQQSVLISLTAGSNPIDGKLAVSAENGSVLAVFTPDAPLPYETQIKVHVEAKDNGKPQPNLATLDYTFTTELAPRYNIVGRIADAAGAPLPAVQVALSGDASAATITDGNGYYRFQDLLGGNYVITPSKEGYVFTPASRTVTLTDDVDNADFTGRLITYALSGQVTKAGRALPGVTITVGTRTVVTGNDGRWRVDGLTAGAYTVVPSLANHRFQPESRTVQIVNADIAGLDFEAIPLSYSIAGLVTDTRGNRLADVVISADGHKAVTGDNGRYSIGGVAAGTVNVRAEKQGWTFFWQDASGALQPLPRPVTVPPDQTDINFVGFRSVRASFSAGIHMIGVPIYPRDPVPMAVFGTPLVARWDPTRQPPAYLTAVTSPDAQLLRVEPGRGFFVRFRQNTDLEVAGEPVRTDAPFNMGLSAGWNMQANPFPAQVPLSSFTVTSGEVRPYAYVYDAVAGQYLLISSTPAVGVARSYVLPWEAVWLRALTSAALQVAPPAETAEAKSVESLQLDLGTGGWWIPVQATAGERTDSCCAVGVSARGDTVMLEKPPAMPGTVDVSIVDTDGARLSRAIVGGAKRTQSWQLVVTTDIPNAEVVLSLPDLSRVPHNITLTLTDLETNKSLYARTMAGYRFQVGAAGGQRRFRLTAEPRTTAGLVVSSASARLAGRNVVVTYSVTTSCQVHARVMNIAGRTVKTIASGSQVAAGVNSLAWDCTNATGAPVPAGMYLIEIEGVAADGQRARTVTQVRIPGR